MKSPYIHIAVVIAFLANIFFPLPIAMADDIRLPAPGVMVHLSPAFNPPILKGIKVHPDNPFRFDFILDQGDEGTQAHKSTGTQEEIKSEATKLIKYFLASLTIPEKDLWVNLSPYEKDRIIPQSFGLTEMGRDLLAEDYMLKQITASLIYPEDEIGKKFWKRIYEEAAKKFGTTNIPVNTFNKVWIVPEKAVVYENVKSDTAYVVESKLKVMLEQDYLALNKNVSLRGGLRQEGLPTKQSFNDVNSLGSQIVRELVIPELTKEVNEDKNFAQLRQVYNSLILATWYKKKIKDSILAQVYEDKKKIAGVGYERSVILSEAKDLKVSKDSSASPQKDAEQIYRRYLQAFKKGVYNYIKEEIDPVTQQSIPRKYFSGGMNFSMNSTSLRIDSSMLVNSIRSFMRRASGSFIVITASLLLLNQNVSAQQKPTITTTIIQNLDDQIKTQLEQALKGSPNQKYEIEYLDSLADFGQKHKVQGFIKAANRGLVEVRTRGEDGLIKDINILDKNILKITPLGSGDLLKVIVENASDNNVIFLGHTHTSPTLTSMLVGFLERPDQYVDDKSFMKNFWKIISDAEALTLSYKQEMTDIKRVIMEFNSKYGRKIDSIGLERSDAEMALASRIWQKRPELIDYLKKIGIEEDMVDDIFLIVEGPAFILLHTDQDLAGIKIIPLEDDSLKEKTAPYEDKRKKLLRGLLGLAIIGSPTDRIELQKFLNTDPRKLKDINVEGLFHDPMFTAFAKRYEENEDDYWNSIDKREGFVNDKIEDYQGNMLVVEGSAHIERLERLLNGKKRVFEVSQAMITHMNPSIRMPFFIQRELNRTYNNFKVSNRRENALIGKNNGGIDFTANQTHLDIQNIGGSIKFQLDFAMLRKFQNADGFVPVIINIQPLKSLPAFLGIWEKTGNSDGMG